MRRTPFRPGLDLPAEQVRANDLYWSSADGVNAVAEAMGVSKGRLYELLLPLAAGVACPECGAELGFPHRTARDRGDATCDGCGFEGSVDGLDIIGPNGAGDADTREESEGARAPLWTPGAGAGTRGSAPTASLVGAALVGVATGLALARWFRR